MGGPLACIVGNLEDIAKEGGSVLAPHENSALDLNPGMTNLDPQNKTSNLNPDTEFWSILDDWIRIQGYVFNLKM